MKQDIQKNWDNARELERLYRSNKSTFKKEFEILYQENSRSELTEFWNERLNYKVKERIGGDKEDLYFVIIASIMAFTLAKFPAIFGITEDNFYQRNIGFIVFLPLTAYFIWKNKLKTRTQLIIFCSLALSSIFINVLPKTLPKDTLMLSCIHLPLILWSVLGFAYVGTMNAIGERLSFLKYNGDLIIINKLILLIGAIFSAITINLFSLIGFQIVEAYMKYVGVFGLVAAPIVGNFLIRSNPQLVEKISPTLAKIFSPIVLVMLMVYLGAIIYAGKSPYNDRDFLMTFNALLISVIAIIFFAVAGGLQVGHSKLEIGILTCLCILTILVNGIALSAILYRILELGITPNRAAVFGGNLLMLIHLIWVGSSLLSALRGRGEIENVAYRIARYMPIYSIWAALVTFLFPFIFG